jgi:hypothetical protein
MSAQALGWMGNKVKKRPDVVNALKAAAKDPDPRLQEEAKKSLKALDIGS